MKRRILAVVVVVWAGVGLVSCGSSPHAGTRSGLPERVLASQGVTATQTFGGLVIVNGEYDTVAPRVPELSAGTSPHLMAISPTRNIAAAFDVASNSVYAVNTTEESNMGHVQLPGATSSMVIPTANTIGYAAEPTGFVDGYSFVGAVEEMDLSAPGAIITTIAVTNAQTVVSNSAGTKLLVFSNDSDSVTVLYPAVAQPPVDTSCLTNPPNALVCTIVQDPRLSRPVYAVINGGTAYILNCGLQCGGSQQASVAVFDLGSLTITNAIPVNGATDALLEGSTLYVAGKGTPTGPLCSSLPSSNKTAATYCGTLDIVDLNTMTDPYYNNPSTELAITDGYHDRMDMSVNGQLFIGSYDCTNIGDIDNPVGEVRGCLSIYNTTTNKVLIPPDNGDVDGLQSFTTRYVEYVAEGGNLRVYDTLFDYLLYNSYVSGTIPIVGYVGDVKAIDFF